MPPPHEAGPLSRPGYEPTEPPTEAYPVVPPAEPVDDGYGEGLVDDEWTVPKQRSRATLVLFVAVLVALGFLLGVFVGRTGSGFERPAGGAAATTSARPAP